MNTPLVSQRTPFVGRARELQFLQDTYRTVRSEGRPLAVWVQGETGCGKSALINEFIEQLRGEVTLLGAAFSASPVAGHSLGPMLAGHFGCPVDSWEDAFRCIHALYGQLDLGAVEARYDAIGMAEMIASSFGDLPGQMPCGFQSPQIRNMAVTRLLARKAQTQPVVLWFDDGDCSRDALSLARHLLDEADFPSMILLAARSPLYASRGGRTQRLIEHLLADASTTILDLAPLSGNQLRSLVGSVAPDDPELVDRVAHHTRGNPLFAIQLVTDWVERSKTAGDGPAAEPTDRDRLADPADASLLDQMYPVWESRLCRALDQLDAAERNAGRRAIEMAAALGPVVDVSEWKACCEATDWTVPSSLEEILTIHDLIELTADGWRFIHASLHHSVRRTAVDRGTWSSSHAICADTLQAIKPVGCPRRVAEHLIEAGRLDQAAQSLQIASRRLFDKSDYDASAACLDKRTEVLDKLGVGPDDRRRIQITIRRAYIALACGDIDRADDFGNAALRHARAEKWTVETAWAALVNGRRTCAMGQWEQAMAHFKLAQRAFDQSNHSAGQAQVSASLAYMHLLRGQAERARQLAGQARTAFARLDDPVMEARACHSLGSVDVLDERWEDAQDHARQALALARANGDRSVEAGSWNLLGEIARARGHLESARSSYQRATRLHRLGHNRNEHVARFNVGVVETADGRFERARQIFEELVDLYPQVGMESRLPLVVAGLLCCAAGQDDVSAYDGYLDRCEHLQEEAQQAYCDEGLLTERAGDLAEARGHHDRARRAWTVASGWYDKLDRRDQIERLADKLGR